MAGMCLKYNGIGKWSSWGHFFQYISELFAFNIDSFQL